MITLLGACTKNNVGVVSDSSLHRQYLYRYVLYVVVISFHGPLASYLGSCSRSIATHGLGRSVGGIQDTIGGWIQAAGWNIYIEIYKFVD